MNYGFGVRVFICKLFSLFHSRRDILIHNGILKHLTHQDTLRKKSGNFTVASSCFCSQNAEIVVPSLNTESLCRGENIGKSVLNKQYSCFITKMSLTMQLSYENVSRKSARNQISCTQYMELRSKPNSYSPDQYKKPLKG